MSDDFVPLPEEFMDECRRMVKPLTRYRQFRDARQPDPAVVEYGRAIINLTAKAVAWSR